MDISLILAKEILELFIIMFMGYIIVKSGVLKSDDSKSISAILVYRLTPCMIINSFMIEYDEKIKTGLIFAFIISILVHILFIILTSLLNKLFNFNVAEKVNIIYTNAGILVIPLISSILGKEYVIYSCAFIVVQLILLWTHCNSLLKGIKKIEIKKIILNVNIISIFIGMLVFIFRINLPSIITDTVDTLGSMMGPVGMLIAGMVMGEVSIINLFKKTRYYFICFLRLILYPLITLFLLYITNASSFIVDGKNILMIVYLACVTPSCATVTSMIQLYNLDAKYSSSLYVLTTLLSIITIPVMIGIYNVLI